jgi:8-oxo-dGTP pyrophosphatase MutT (NUDIX family)/phosphohistidine phosphatase SixA
MGADPIIAAGCLVTRGRGDDTEVMLVHRPKYDDWSLPKGKQNNDEHILETAVREVLEETGMLVALRQPLPQRSYKVEGEPKVVHYWRAEVLADQGFVPNREVDDIKWLPVEAAATTVTHPLDGELIRRALEPPSLPFVVLRHGHATKRAAWAGEDIDRPLDPEGVAQSDALIERLAAYGLTRVHSSAARRCLQTVQPFAEHEGIPLVAEPELTEQAFTTSSKAAKARVAGLVADALHRDEPTLLCGHRPYLPELVNHLLDGSGITGPQDNVPVGSMIVLHYVARPADDGDLTHAVTALEHHFC